MELINLLICFTSLFTSIESTGITFVIDTALSMKSEIEHLQSGIRNFVSNFSSEVSEFVVVPFNEPDIGPITKTKYAQEFEIAINNLSGKGTRDCPEISVEGLLRGLQTSEHKSKVYLFTDAYTDDLNGINTIKDQCRSTSSEVSVILTRSCAPNSAGFDVTSHYQDITDACGGQLIIMNAYNLPYVFKYIRHQLQWDDQVFTTDDSIHCNSREHNIAIEQSASKALVLIFGNVHYSNIRDDNGNTNIENIMNSKTFKAYLLKDPKNAKLKCTGFGKVTIKIATRTSFPFALGFSTHKPTVMKETTSKPIPSWNSYVLVSPLDRLLTPVLIEIISTTNKDDKHTLSLAETLPGIRLYVGGGFYPPSERFKIVITYYTYDKNYISQISTDWDVQKLGNNPKHTRPMAEMIEIYPEDADYGDERSLACKVTAYPRPVMWWEDDLKTRYKSTDSILEMPNVFMSYINIKNITRSARYYCHSKNSEGDDTKSAMINVKMTRKFEVVKMPTDTSIEFETEGVLNCKVDASPKATVKWYLNNTDLSNNDRIYIDEDKLIINSMSLDDVGLYACEVRNDYKIQRFDATVSITGLEAPTAFIEAENIQIKTGASLDISCRVRGKPTPKITWKYKKSEMDDFEDLPSNALGFNDLSIDNVQARNQGIYRCTANNVVGNDYKDVFVMVGAPPVIEEDISNLTVSMHVSVRLPCKVESDTSVRVNWELIKYGVSVALHEDQNMDEEYTLRFRAQWNDEGEYVCTAENEAGSAERRVSVNILVPPYIQSQSPKILEVDTGTDVSIPCDLLYGSPRPTMSWVFIPLNTSRQEKLSADESNTLHLVNIKAANEGEYVCSATNEVGYDAIKVLLRLNKT